MHGMADLLMMGQPPRSRPTYLPTGTSESAVTDESESSILDAFYLALQSL